ncbi:MAG: tryptophanase [Bacteroidales bacterium]|mgnify:FL=1|jgi:tryptophanase|nr:tryptophanase [Bacteroidales bacterium]MBQ2376130.1 tryptophanase [Bacteroidales bacterium]MBQ2397065.1 tryptophanase [Bacteroidales bacterium]MBQ5872661.1 tryptophanase [Bacteroidales bacterium]MBQ5891153.1 tryptophanase [Bacteroidales bacterium]
MELPFAESWKIKMVEPIRKSTRQEREQWLKEAHNNVFMLKSEQVYIDCITDSGTGSMSDRQWAAMMMGDESYAGARSFYRLKDTITSITGFEYVIPTHQGRAAENVLFSHLVKQGDIVPGNSHFDTTKGHIESRKATALDCTIDEAKDTQLEIPFKGNVDPKKLEKALAENADKIPFVIVTVTNNTAGGQPVSMENLRQVREVANKYNKPVILDSARFAENAYFIKMREKGYENKTIKEIAKEMFSYADGMTMSAKKDGIVNMGGFIATRKKEWYEGAKLFCIPFEGFLTYGGMNGRDMEALAVGLDENTEFDNLDTRIRQVQYLAAKLDEYGIPYQRPVGGHAIFVDADKILTNVPKEEFPAQTLTCELYLEAGIRGCEIGYILADRDPVTRENRFGGLDFVRLCVPRRVYTNNHMDVIAAALKNVYDRRDEITRGVKITWEAELMRHFTVQLERL